MADETSLITCPKTVSDRPDEFTLFSSLPVELQCRIFKEAYPDPELRYWDFQLQSAPGGGDNDQLCVRQYRHRGLLSLLLACKNSHAEFFRNYEKIEINLPVSIPFTSSRPSDRYRYVRKTVDTFSMGVVSFMSLYNVGGSMSLNNITHLALNVEIDDSYMDLVAKLYISLSIHCPALKTLNFVLDDSMSKVDWDIPTYPQLVDNGEQYIEYDSTLENLKEIEIEAKGLMKNFDRFMNTTENDFWDKPGEETLKYWKNIRPTPVLLLICEDHFSAHPCSCTSDYPELYFKMYGGSVRVRKDGTPLHKYTGLRQIFEGEPW
ncbi:hypothetical protein EAE96_002883 [Botrytis aclada]|nr:hypothetical protein EAE96_002883 [Botrytis aclada]